MIVWIVNPFDNLPSEGNRPQRYWLMSEAFVRAGHRVVYWTSDFSHATKRKRLRLKAEEDSGFEVVEIPTLPYKKNICWARVKSHRTLARDFEAAARDFATPDLVIASAPPLGLCAAAMRVAKRCGATFVCDIQDAWPETFERVLPRWIWTLLGLRATARRIYVGSDGISAVAQRYIELAQTYGAKSPMHVAGHAISQSPDNRQPTPDNRQLATDNRQLATDNRQPTTNLLRLVYAGNMSLSYDLETVIKAVRDMPNVTLDIAGSGPDLDRLKKFSTSSAFRRGQDNIRFHGYLGERDLAELLRRCDVGIVPMFPESCVGVPGKLADYAAAGLRVIESLGGECQRIVEHYGVGVHYTSGDVASFQAALSRLPPPPTSTCFLSSPFAAHFDAHKIMDDYVTWCGGILK